jgi:hypothetical protein
LGEIEFNGEDSAGNKQQYAIIHGSILSPTSTAEAGQIHFETATAGASTEKMIIGTSNLVINDIGSIFNVRIEGDADANLFFTDATNDRIGVGTISPSVKLDVNGLVKISTTIGVGAATPAASGAGITFPASQSASSDVNTLDDYEEGTWTPNQGTGVTAIGAFSSGGDYVKIGRLVMVTGRINAATSVAVTMGGELTSNLPFTSITATQFAIGGATDSNGSISNTIYGQSNNKQLYVAEAFVATPGIYFSITYLASA